MDPIFPDELIDRKPGESSSSILERVMKAMQILTDRYKKYPGIYNNSQMPEAEIDRICLLDDIENKFLL